jgi:hypothetical protein
VSDAKGIGGRLEAMAAAHARRVAIAAVNGEAPPAD